MLQLRATRRQRLCNARKGGVGNRGERLRWKTHCHPLSKPPVHKTGSKCLTPAACGSAPTAMVATSAASWALRSTAGSGSSLNPSDRRAVVLSHTARSLDTGRRVSVHTKVR